MSADFYFTVANLLKAALICLSIIAGLLFLAGLVYLPVTESRKRKRGLRQIYSGRKALDEDQFYARFYQWRGIPKDVVIRIRRILGEELDLDISWIVPEDDFTGNLAILWGNWSGLDGLVAVEVVQQFEKEFGISINN